MSCLFDSLSHFIGEGSYEIRQKICDYLQENKQIIDGLGTSNILELENCSAEQYISNMRLMSSWGGAIEIQCACNIWNAHIIVHDIRNRRCNNNCNNNKIEFLPLKSSTNLPSIEFHLEWSGGHYEPRKN